MRWYKELYIGETLRNDAALVQAEVRAFLPPPEIYLICLSTNGVDLLDITPTVALKQIGAKNRTWDIIGMARGKDEAVKLAAAIIEDVWKKTGALDVRTFVDGQMIAD